MRILKIAVLAGTALLAAGCGGRDDANVNTANELGSNLLLDQPMNDASAMESAANATTPLVPLDNATTEQPYEPLPPSGNTSVESNVTGM